jgi:hypothetical protein
MKAMKAPDFEPFTLVVGANALSEEPDDGPRYAEVTVTPDFIERILRLSRLCAENDLTYSASRNAVDRWEREEKLRIRGDFLQVFCSFFYFEAYSEYLDCEVRTYEIDISTLASVAVLSTEGAGFRRVGDRVFYADDEDALDGLINLYEGKDEGGTCDECGARVKEVIGCPDGAEICKQCFDQGAH